jgi:hypothetical protein
MRLPQFLLGMLVISGSVAAWAYLTTGSVWVALAWTAINATLLQVGYFVLLVRMIHLPLPGQPKQVAVDAQSRRRAAPPLRLLALLAVALAATVGMTAKSRADGDDAYFACVIGKAEAIMRTQARKDAETALAKAYALCQAVGTTEQAQIGGEPPLPDRPGRLYPLVNS